MKDEEDKNNEDEESKKKSEESKKEEKKKLDHLNDFPGEKLQNPELSPEQKEERAFLSGLLFEQTEQFTENDQQRKRSKEDLENQIIELSDGRKISVKDLRAPVVGKKQPYMVLFPKESEFFSEMFRLNWPDKDPTKYSKPYMASQYLIRVIYNRFNREVLPALKMLNPIVTGGFRKHKLSQYLDGDAKEQIIQFREDAVSLMKEFPDLDWYRFEKEYCKRYGLPFQKSVFDVED
jgi:hypothetical protein